MNKSVEIYPTKLYSVKNMTCRNNSKVQELLKAKLFSKNVLKHENSKFRQSEEVHNIWENGTLSFSSLEIVPEKNLRTDIHIVQKNGKAFKTIKVNIQSINTFYREHFKKDKLICFGSGKTETQKNVCKPYKIGGIKFYSVQVHTNESIVPKKKPKRHSRLSEAALLKPLLKQEHCKKVLENVLIDQVI